MAVSWLLVLGLVGFALMVSVIVGMASLSGRKRREKD